VLLLIVVVSTLRDVWCLVCSPFVTALLTVVFALLVVTVVVVVVLLLRVDLTLFVIAMRWVACLCWYLLLR